MIERTRQKLSHFPCAVMINGPMQIGDDTPAQATRKLHFHAFFPAPLTVFHQIFFFYWWGLTAPNCQYRLGYLIRMPHPQKKKKKKNVPRPPFLSSETP